MSAYSIRMGALNMNGQPDINGDVFVVSDIEGLWGPELDLQLTQRSDMGERVDSSRYKALTPVVAGVAYSSSNASMDVLRLRKKLNANSYLLAPGLLYLDEPTPGVAMQMTVQRGGELDLPPPSYNVQRFEIPLIAPDPRKYSQQLKSVVVNGGPVSVVNAGTAPTPAVATLPTRSETNPWIECFGQGRLSISGTFVQNSWIDFARKQTYDSTDGYVERAVRPRVWWELLPGTNSVQSSVNLGANNWTLTYRDAWL